MATLDPTQYTLVPFVLYDTLPEKMQALLNGESLLIKAFEQREKRDVLIRLEQKKFTVAQMSYDVYQSEDDPRYWITYNIGINDLSLFTCFKFEENTFELGNRYMINDVVLYVSEDGKTDTAIVEEVYVSNLDPSQFAYRLSRDDGLYAEEDLLQHKYM
ncbi:hypothetical protein BSP36_155 [Bacillus phage BSP36]|uniref:Uncharacterized protein n=1 Tax=Bacillus phage BSP38 TaxID=2283013 RepID=A0A345MK19_BPBSP|nr:virion structural protein [Bacillus phage BSP38]AXH71201.1 hypothetical protein BSP38_159 [Bacillus phage BSP38]AYJ75242.1 hypothetical protein BSP36_155 [Bacillus phage BSP36]